MSYAAERSTYSGVEFATSWSVIAGGAVTHCAAAASSACV